MVPPGAVHERWRTLAVVLFAAHIYFLIIDVTAPSPSPAHHHASLGAPQLAPQALGLPIEPHTGYAWPLEFRTWVSDDPFLLSRIFSMRSTTHGSDKSSSHRYQFLYAKYLLPLRHQKIKLLEIGLGCGMPWGAGHSVSLWRELLPRATYFSIEFDRECAENFRGELGERLFIGDQGDAAFLRTVVDAIGPDGLDVIVDDGSHQVAHQRASLEHLFFALKKGGLYIMEDMQTSGMPQFGGEPSFTAPTGAVFAAQELLVSMMGRPGTRDALVRGLFGHVVSLDCFFHACVFQRGPGPDEWQGPPHPIRRRRGLHAEANATKYI